MEQRFDKGWSVAMKYKLLDFDGRWAWIRLPDGSYIVDYRYEKDFLFTFSSADTLKVLQELQERHEYQLQYHKSF